MQYILFVNRVDVQVNHLLTISNIFPDKGIANNLMLFAMGVWECEY